MENLSDTLVTILVVAVTLLIANMQLRIKKLEKKLGY